jgi:hypothetical protein
MAGDKRVISQIFEEVLGDQETRLSSRTVAK